MLQIRQTQINWDFIDRAVTKIETTGNRDGLNKKGTVVFFPDDAEYEGTKIRAGSFCVIDGSQWNCDYSKSGSIKERILPCKFQT